VDWKEQREKEIDDSVREKERDMRNELRYLQDKDCGKKEEKSFWLYNMKFTYPLDQDDWYKIEMERKEEQRDREFWNRRLGNEI